MIFSCSDEEWGGEDISRKDDLLSGFVPDPLGFVGFR